MKILITGGAGFVGINLLLKLIEKELFEEVIVLDYLGYTSNPEIINNLKKQYGLKFVEGSILNSSLIDEIVEQVDIIVHLAAESYVDYSIDSPTLFYKTNVEGTLVLLESARKRKISRFVHISTDEVWGDAYNRKDFIESSCYLPLNPYSASKASADHFVRAWGNTYDLPYNIVHFVNLFGPFQYPEKLIPRCIVNLMNGKPIELFGNGKQTRTWLYISDAVDGLLAVIENGQLNHSYIVGSEFEYSNFEIANMILDEVGIDESAIKFVEDRPGHDQRYAVDISKIRKDLNWHPNVQIGEGIEKTVHWLKKNKDWWSQRQKHINFRQGLS